MAMNYDLTIKTILIGDSSVGKSSLLYRYTDDDWNPYYIATIGVDFKVKTMERYGKVIKFQLWDTAGQERFRSITQTYYRGAHAIAMVFDVNDRDSFDGLKIWLNDVKNFGAVNVPVVILGNKADLAPPAGSTKPRAVSTEEAKQFADAYGFAYFETSAKDGTNVQAAFDYVVDLCIDQREKLQLEARGKRIGGVRIPVGVNDTTTTTNNGNGKISFCGCN